MADQQKDTIYIDIDDEITAIIDKVRASSSKVVALVLPKRATTLQSIVNMKLLKRSAEETKKNLVLVTTESSLLPLAGAVGLHVAKTPSSRPEIPVAPGLEQPSDLEESVNLDDDTETPKTADNAGAMSVGELAGSTMPLPAKPLGDSGIETVELDNADEAVAPAATASKAPKPKKDKKLHVPDFDRFRLLLIGGGALLLILLALGYVAFFVLPKATISIKTNASNVNTNVDFTLNTTAQTLNESTKIVPAKQAQSQKTYTGNATATGQKNNGDKATGSVTMAAGSCSANVPANVPANFAISANSKTYLTRESTTFQPVVAQGKCTYRATSQTEIVAQTGGASFNTNGNSNFSVRSDVSASGSASGGTDDIQTVVSQADIDSAKAKINADDNSVQGDLKQQLEDQGLMAITTTFNSGTPTTTTSSKVGDAASSVTVTQNTTYSMLGANEADIKTLVDADIKDQIDASKQSILSRGITQGSFKLKDTTDKGASLNIQTTAEVGPAIDTAQIATDAAGKKSGDIKASVSANPDVTDVTVELSPFWVSSAPKNVKKITVTVAKPTATADAN